MIEPSAAIIVVICQLVRMEARPTEIQFEEEDSSATSIDEESLLYQEVHSSEIGTSIVEQFYQA